MDGKIFKSGRVPRLKASLRQTTGQGVFRDFLTNLIRALKKCKDSLER
jgi:hypothetical protein